MVVEIALCRIGGERRRQDGVDQLLCSGLAVAARDRQKRNIELAAVVEGQLLEGDQDVGDEDDLVGGIAWDQFQPLGRLIEDHIGGAELEGFCGKGIAVEVGSFEGEEEVAPAQQAGVSLDRWVAEIDLVKLFDSHKKALPKISNLFAYLISMTVPLALAALPDNTSWYSICHT
jgi:hypothetical protein